MRRDSIVDEVRGIREEIAREYGNDVKAIVAALQRQEAANPVGVVSLIAKRLPKKQTDRKAG